MGVDANHCRWLMSAWKRGVSFRRTILIGRQFCVLTLSELIAIMAEYGFELNETTSAELETVANGWCEPLLRLLGAEVVESVDATGYEEATIIHDMNSPLPSHLRGRFDVVIDGGTLEHVFNFPVAIKNCMEMLDVGGHYLGVAPANNWCGHGFYQFSPDLFFRIFSEENGFVLERAILCEVRPDAEWREVADVLESRRFLELKNEQQTYCLTQAKKIADVSLLENAPQQGIYQLLWKGEQPRGVDTSITAFPAHPEIKQREGRSLTYDRSFFDRQVEGSLSSARVVLPILFDYFKPSSIVDVGCGRGTWLKAAAECGVKDLLGLDGDYVERDALLIEAGNFQVCNLAEGIDLPKRFDLAVSVEVAEHLPFQRAESFVGDLVRLSDLVLFSAALPYQGGTDHINEQWLEFWAILFRRHGYVACDFVRRRIWGNKSVEYWYSQNLMLFCKEDIARALFPSEMIAVDRPLSFVHPLTFVFNTTRFRPLSGQALYPEFEDYQNLLTSYLAGETNLPLLKTPSAIGETGVGKVDLFPNARTRITNPQEEVATRDSLIQRQSDELKAREQEVAALRATLVAKDQTCADLRATLAARDQTCADLQAIAATKDETIRAQQAELQIFRTSKLQRLRYTILYEKLSAQKLAKIVYFMVALATPERVRVRLRPFIPRLKRVLASAKQPRPKIERLTQKEWPADLPLMSVVIPCFNYGRYVEQAVDSVLSQTFQNFEIIVVDGGSTDEDTLRILKSFQKSKTKVYLRNGRHLVGDNRNFGIRQSRGKYICCLDADDQLKSTYLEKALFLLETYHYELVSSSVEWFGAHPAIFEVVAKPNLEQMEVSNQFATVAIFTRELWETAQGYHDWGLGKDHVAEDWDLWMRMMALGARAINIPEALMLYRVHDASLSKQPEVRSWAEQGEEILKFNKEHLKRRNYLLSAKRNAAIVQVQDPYLNLVTSYQKTSRKPAILLALPFTITGGADTVLLDMAEHLTANGFDLSVVTTLPADRSFGDNTAKYEALTHHQVYHLYKFLPEESKWKDFLFYLIETRNIGMLLLAGSAYVYGLLPEIKRRFPQLKVVDQLFNEFGHIENNRKYSSYIDFHIVANEVIKDILVKTHGEKEDKVRVIVHGVDVDELFNPDRVEVGTDTSTVLPQGKSLVSFVGRFSEEKCPEKFLEIARLLKDEENLHFLMIGNGPEYPRIKQCIRELALENKISTPGFVPDLRAFLKASRVVVVPSNIEGIPIVLMESLALGVPVVASAVGGIPFVIQDGLNGFLCEPSDIKGFVRAIKNITENQKLHIDMKANARDFALRRLNVRSMKDEYRNLFVELLSESHTQEKWPEDRPLVSVVIPSFNYGRYLQEAVDSVLSQTFSDFEIIIVESASTDDTPRILRSLNMQKIKVYFRKERHPLGDNRNFGIARARGKYICCLDADDRLKPTYLEKALFLLESYCYEIVSTSVQCFGESAELWQLSVDPSLEALTQANQFSVVAVFMKQLWEKAGGYRDRGLGKDLVAEDWDLWMRMMALGARAINIPEALMLYRVHDASLSKQPEVRSWAEQGEEILKFNKEHLKRRNYLLSAKRNAAIVQVQDPYLNLVTSYQKTSRKPAILLALPFTITGGADTVLLDMAEHLTANGFDLSVVTTLPADRSFGDNTAKYEALTHHQVYHLYKFLPEESKWKDFLFYLIETRNIGMLLLAGSAYVYGLLPEIKRRFPQLKVVDQLFNEFGHIENNRKYSSYIDFHIVANEVIKDILVKTHGEKEDKVRVKIGEYSKLFAELWGEEPREISISPSQDRADSAFGS